MRAHRLLPGVALLALTALGAGPLSAEGPPSHAPGSVGAPEGPASEIPAGAGLAGFGAAVAMVDDLAFVGSPGAFAFFPMPPNRAGRVHVFQAEGGSWVELAVVASPGDEVGDAFGAAVAARGDWLAVGAPSAGDGAGAAYLFRRQGDRWVEAARAVGNADEGLGTSVAVTGRHWAIGAPGRGPGAVDVLALDDPSTVAGTLTAEVAAGARFGAALSGIDAELLVGAPGPGIDGSGFGGPPAFRPGSAHHFRWSNGTWALDANLTPLDAQTGAMGWAVVLAEDRAFVGAPFANGASGRVHTYAREGAGWAAGEPLTSGLQGQAGLGMALAWSGSELLAAAPFQGLVLAFAPAPGGMTEVQRIQGTPGQAFYGAALAARGEHAVVGAPGEAMFMGLGHVLARTDDGWTSAGTVEDGIDAVEPVTGEMVPCTGPDAGTDGSAAGFPCAEVDLVAYLPVDALGAERGILVNDVWGWTDAATGREYALVGRSDATVFVDVTDAGNPAVLGALPLSDSASVSLWRDMKVYADHVFVVADAAGAHGIQVFDLTQLRGLTADPDRTFEETGHYDGIFSAHNIVINEDSGFAYVVGASSGGTTCGGGLHMVDVREPSNPTFAGCFQDASTGLAGTGYSHDAQCINYRGPDPDHAGSEICFGANENALSIADVTDKENPRAISTASYPNSAYLHQGWVSEDHRFFFMNDEGDEISGQASRTRTLVWDIEDLDDPVLLTEHLGTTEASDHNLYVRGNLMYQSNYVSGLRILDVTDPANPVEVGWFDTVPQGEDAPGFAGSWSNYPFFDSGTILVTSMREGLFLLKKTERRAVF